MERQERKNVKKMMTITRFRQYGNMDLSKLSRNDLQNELKKQIESLNQLKKEIEIVELIKRIRDILEKQSRPRSVEKRKEKGFLWRMRDGLLYRRLGIHYRF